MQLCEEMAVDYVIPFPQSSLFALIKRTTTRAMIQMMPLRKIATLCVPRNLQVHV